MTTPCSLVRSTPTAIARWLGPLCVVAAMLMWALTCWGAPAIPAAPQQHVTDRAGVMSAEVRAGLERRLSDYEAGSGHQIVVWIDASTGELDIERFAAEAFEQWKLGRAKLDDGLALFVMVEDRTIRIEVGYGLEGVVTDLVASRVISETMRPAIQAGDWDHAIVDGVEALADTIEGHPNALAGDDQVHEGDGTDKPAVPPNWVRIAKIAGAVIAGLALLILFITNPGLALALLFFFLRGRGGGGGGGGFQGGGGRSGGGGATGRW